MKTQAEAQSEVKSEAMRYHNVFVKNKDGAKLFEEWISKYCFGNFTAIDATAIELARAEGKREMVAMIVAKIQQAESM